MLFNHFIIFYYIFYKNIFFLKKFFQDFLIKESSPLKPFEKNSNHLTIFMEKKNQKKNLKF